MKIKTVIDNDLEPKLDEFERSGIEFYNIYTKVQRGKLENVTDIELCARYCLLGSGNY